MSAEDTLACAARPAAPEAGRPAGTPWSALDEQGQGLGVDAFLTTLMSQVGSALRRSVTLPGVQQLGLTVSEWHLLAHLARARRLGFAELVRRSESDKALVSRTLKLLAGRGLVALSAEGGPARRRIGCRITPAGAALHARALPLAQARQAAAIRLLSPEDRDGLYRALQRLRSHCSEASAEAEAGAACAASCTG